MENGAKALIGIATSGPQGARSLFRFFNVLLNILMFLINRRKKKGENIKWYWSGQRMTKRLGMPKFAIIGYRREGTRVVFWTISNYFTFLAPIFFFKVSSIIYYMIQFYGSVMG